MASSHTDIRTSRAGCSLAGCSGQHRHLEESGCPYISLHRFRNRGNSNKIFGTILENLFFYPLQCICEHLCVYGIWRQRAQSCLCPHARPSLWLFCLSFLICQRRVCSPPSREFWGWNTVTQATRPALWTWDTQWMRFTDTISSCFSGKTDKPYFISTARPLEGKSILSLSKNNIF